MNIRNKPTCVVIPLVLLYNSYYLKNSNSLTTIVGIFKKEGEMFVKNRKRQHSRIAIEHVFVELLQEKSLEKITVVEICRKAKVNRSTFYSNYIDVYDLMEHVSGKFFGEMFHRCVADLGEPNPNGREGTKIIVERALTATLEQRELCKILLGSVHKTNFTRKLLDTVLEWSESRYTIYSGAEVEQFRLENTIMLGGVLTLWERWVESDCQGSHEMLTQVICNHISENTKRIWNRNT